MGGEGRVGVTLPGGDGLRWRTDRSISSNNVGLNTKART
jgi:hypothetical protein